MDRRAFERVPTSFKIRFISSHSPDSAVVSDFSENGMRISTGYCLPCDDTSELLIPLTAEILKVRVKIRRLVKVDNLHYVLGVELLAPPNEYLEFVVNHRNLFKSLKGFQFNDRYRLFNYDI
jgi:hypothetical protein